MIRPRVPPRLRGPLDAARSRVASMPLFWKLLAPGLLVVFVLAAATLFVTVRLSAEQESRGVEDRLSRESLAARSATQDAEFEVVQAARATALLQGLPEALRAGDEQGLTDLLVGAYVLRFRLDVLVATDADGSALLELSGSRTVPTRAAGSAWGSRAVFDKAIRAGATNEAGPAEATSGIAMTKQGALFLSVAPVRDASGHAGFVAAGVSVKRVLHDAAPGRDAVFALYDDGTLLGASSTPPPIGDAVSSDRARRVATEVSGRHYETRLDPFAPHGERLGTLAVSVPRTSDASFVRSTGLRLLALAVLALAALAGLYAVIARAAVARVRDLRDVARRLGHGELSARADVEGTDELGELAVGVNHMAEELAAVQHEIERRVAAQTAELRRLNDRSEKAFERQADALALISHEFRNPIFAILGHAHLMLDDRLRPEGEKWPAEFGTTIRGAAEELLRHVNDILAFSRAQAGSERLHLEAIDVATELTALQGTFDALARRADLTLRVEVGGRVPAARANADAVRDVALNLVSNAVKYTPPGGDVRISLRADGDRVALAVTDTGVGIPRGEQRDIFEPFYRVEGVRPMHGQLSTGLGLALTKRLVKSMGGTVRVESEVGAGSTFTVSLQAARRRAGAPPTNGNGSGSRVRARTSQS